MSLRAKFNVVLSVVFLIGFVVSASISYALLKRSARQQVIDNAGIMMASALAVRGYTVEQIRPLLQAGGHDDFLPQSVPAYAATETFTTLRDTDPDFTYKEATSDVGQEPILARPSTRSSRMAGTAKAVYTASTQTKRSKESETC